MTAAMRRVKGEIPTYKDLHLPKVYEDLVLKTHEGLVLVSGVTGSGKSSTLAAMLDHVNETRRTHIITIEDPIEFAFIPKKSIISQREIGIDIPNFAEALRYVVRQDPDVILIGELRDADTMMAALQAAETGHLVLASIHTSDATQAFSRILEFFPRNQHVFIRSSIANSLAAICCQRLVPASDEKIGRLPATEILIANATVVDKIRRDEDEDMPAIMETSTQEGMRTFTHSLAELIEMEMIYFDTAMKYAPNRDALAAAVRGIKSTAGGLVGKR